MNIANLLHRAAVQHGSLPALTVHDRPACSYREMAQRMRSVGAVLRRRYGLDPGDRVALAMSNRPAFYEILFGAWHAGLVAVPMNCKLHGREFAFMLTHSSARVCLTSPELASVIAGVADDCPSLMRVIDVDSDEYRAALRDDDMDQVDVEPTTPAWLFYTSGTTGRPKGATLTHRNLLMMILAYYADIDPVQPGGSFIHAAPMSHGSGLYGLAHVARATNQVIPTAGRFDPQEIWSLVKQHGRASLFAAPTMVNRLVDALVRYPNAVSRLDTLVYGGAPMYSADLERALEAIGPRLAEIYGQGEAPMTITGLSRAEHAEREHPLFRERLASVGYPRTGVLVRIADSDGRPVEKGVDGEVLVKGDVVMAGYWKDPENTARSLREGWLCTGDVGQFDGDGFLVLKGRSKDLVISGGSNVYPREIEEILLQHPGVADVAVVGVPDPEWGEAVTACVVPVPGAEVAVDALDRFCLDRIARFKRPRHYHFLNDMPRNSYGKVPKARLRKMLSEPADEGQREQLAS